MMWLFVPALERWWGTPRFLRFAGYTAVTGTALGTLAGLALGRPAPILGLDPFIYASIVAYGIIYGKQHVQFFGVVPLTGRQLMYGIIGFVALFVLLQQDWELGAALRGRDGPGGAAHQPALEPAAWPTCAGRSGASAPTSRSSPAASASPRKKWVN